MSLRALPLLVIVFILYNMVVLFGGSGTPEQILATPILPQITLPSTGKWSFSWNDLLMLLVLILLFVELVKSTYTSTASLVDHGLSMVLFVACLIEFLIIPRAATSVFFFITVAALIDVVAGYTIGIRVARRDLNIGAEG